MNQSPTPRAGVAAPSDYFQRRTRDDGTLYVVLADDRPEWLYEAVRAAHDDEPPNDWRYETCHAIAEALAEGDERDEIADRLVDIYTTDLLSWLAGDLSRVGYVDEALAEGDEIADRGGLVSAIMAGQYAAISAMVDILAEALADAIADASYVCDTCGTVGTADDGISGDGDDCPDEDCAGSVHVDWSQS